MSFSHVDVSANVGTTYHSLTYGFITWDKGLLPEEALLQGLPLNLSRLQLIEMQGLDQRSLQEWAVIGVSLTRARLKAAAMTTPY